MLGHGDALAVLHALEATQTLPPLGSFECAHKNPEKEFSKLKTWWVPLVSPPELSIT